MPTFYQTWKERLSEVQKQIFDSLSGSASNTAKSLGALQERLIAIDKALKLI